MHCTATFRTRTPARSRRSRCRPKRLVDVSLCRLLVKDSAERLNLVGVTVAASIHCSDLAERYQRPYFLLSTSEPADFPLTVPHAPAAVPL